VKVRYFLSSICEGIDTLGHEGGMHNYREHQLACDAVSGAPM
jgi:hypothetical protein